MVLLDLVLEDRTKVVLERCSIALKELVIGFLCNGLEIGDMVAALRRMSLRVVFRERAAEFLDRAMEVALWSSILARMYERVVLW